MRKRLPKVGRKARVKKLTPALLKRTSNQRLKAKRKTKDALKKAAISQPAASRKIKSTSPLKEKAPQKVKLPDTRPKVSQKSSLDTASSALPLKYGDNRLVILPRDPFWLYAYWDISQEKVNEVISSLDSYKAQNLKWLLRVYDVSGTGDFRGKSVNSFFDIEINFNAGSWYINVNIPERTWCAKIGFITAEGEFFPLARSNIVKTPQFGISSLVDEEWVLPEEEYFRILGVYDLGKSSLEIKKRMEEAFKQQVSSPLASWGISSLFSQKAPPKDKFFLETATELILYGRTRPGAEVSVEGRKIALNKQGTFSLRYALPPGDFKFTVTAQSKNKKNKLTKTLGVKRYNK